MTPALAAPALGARLQQQGGQHGVGFAVWAPQAEGVDVCLFDTLESPQTRRVKLTPQGDGIWQTFVPGLAAGQLYGLRASGPWNPSAGERFNPARLLLDPWALALVGDTSRLALQTGHVADNPLKPEATWHTHALDPEDNAAHMPRCVVLDSTAELAAGQAIAPCPAVSRDQVFIYEAHVKALTRLHPDIPQDQRGTYAALGHPAMLAHLQRLGITTVCLLPVHAHISERHLLARGLTNHWGYNTLNAFAPHAGYATATGGRDPCSAIQAAAVRAEFRQMVDALHRAGIEVVLDVVFNHTAESDPDGPTLCWRGLGQNAWYAMGEHGVPHNFSGCGNSLNVSEPRVVQWVMDSLRWWVQAFGVDGFRFDLAVSLGRVGALGHTFHPHAPLLSAISQDPVLRRVRLIAEPWDIGPNGYHLGGFAPGWLEWNDRFRDDVRAFWLGHPATRGALAQRVCASSDRFGHNDRLPTASVNLITAHDGFNLADLTAYQHKHNQANGEDNRDGHGHNLSANAGAEGPSQDPAVLYQRGLWRRALLATLFCSQGTPQLLAGDEIGHSQQGNNNSYCQDNAITWLDWTRTDGALCHFVAGLAALRRRHPGLRHARWFSGATTDPGASATVTWMDFHAQPLSSADWQDTHQRGLVALIEVGGPSTLVQDRLLLAWQGQTGSTQLHLPPGLWWLQLDSASGWVVGPHEAGQPARGEWVLNGPGVCLLVQGLHGLTPATPSST